MRRYELGTWVWVFGDTYPHREDLKRAGFRYQHNKNMWYLKPAGSAPYHKTHTPMAAIRAKYGSSRIPGEYDNTDRIRA
jgi:hypothetical protein